MSTPATVPIFDPQGVLRDVPQAQMLDAVRAGGTVGVKFQAPDQSIRYVPANRTQDAVKAGGKIMPIEQQDVQHPGFWANLGSDLGGMAKGLWHAAVDPLTDTHEDLVRKLHEEQASEAALENSPEHQAHGAFYRNVTTPAAQAIGVNVPGMEESAAQGDVAGVAGHAAAVPVAMAATEGAMRGVPAVSAAVKEAAPIVKPAAEFGAKVADVATFERASKIFKAYKNMRAQYGELAEPTTELQQASALSQPATTAPEPAAALQQVPLAQGEALKNRLLNLPDQTSALDRLRNQEIPPAQPQYPAERPSVERLADYPVTAPAETAIPARMQVPTAETPTGAGMPRTMQGESALRQVLTGQDNAELLKIAKARGINVSKEAQLKPGAANGLLVGKIIDDFSPEELEEIRAQYIENTRFRHVFGDVGPEAWKTMSLQTYFPDMKISASRLARTEKAIRGSSVSPVSPAPSAVPDLTQILEESLKRVRQAKGQTQ